MPSDGSLLGSFGMHNCKLLLKDNVVLQLYLRNGKQMTYQFASNHFFFGNFQFASDLGILLEISSRSRNIVAIAHDLAQIDMLVLYGCMDFFLLLILCLYVAVKA